MRPVTLVVLVSVWVSTVCNIALWRAFWELPELHNVRGFGFGVAFCVVVTAGNCALLALFNWRGVLKPALIFFLFSAAVGVYFMLSFGVVLDVTMMTNVVQTTPSEARDLLGWRFAASLLLFAGFPAIWLVRRPLRRQRFGRQLAINLGTVLASLVLLAGALLLVSQDFTSLMRNHPQLRYLIAPLNSYYSLGVIALKPFQRDEHTLLPIAQDARLGPGHAAQKRPPLLLLVLGETARAASFGVLGYERPTTPWLSKMDTAGSIASQRNAWSCGTNTAASLPCMFSHLDGAEFDDRKANYENLLDVLQRVGFAVLWIDNQSGCKGVCDRVPNVSTGALQDPRFCARGECFDAIMLDGLAQRIAALPPERAARGVVIVLHQMGSHGPAYYRRSPREFKRFLPECTENALQACSLSSIVNAYDNTILYTDDFLHEAMQELQALAPQFDTAMIYVSDHGESLGENNLYLHGLPYRIAPDVQKHVPWINWLSRGFSERRGVRMACLRARADRHISHDDYFHSVLGLLDVQTSVYKSGFDLFSACTAKR